MCDECHTCGRDTFQKAWELIKDEFGPNKKHLIGVTASPDRMDSYPVIETMFGDLFSQVYHLYLHKNI